MTGLVAVVLLAAASWLVRLSFIVLVPAHRLPRRFTAALRHVSPAMLAALVSVQTVGVMRGESATSGLAVLGCLAAIAAVARRRPSLTVSAGLGIAAVVLLDVVLVR
jgi:branched-subunit amino acid transport protein